MEKEEKLASRVTNGSRPLHCYKIVELLRRSVGIWRKKELWISSLGYGLQLLIFRLGNTHWEEFLQSVSDFIFSKHCGYRSRGVRGVKRPEILWEIQKYSLPGRPSSQNWVKSKTIKKFIKIPLKMANCFLFYSILAGWSTWEWVFLNFT